MRVSTIKDNLRVIALIVSAISCSATVLVVPECRGFLGLEPTRPIPTSMPAATATAAAASPVPTSTQYLTSESVQVRSGTTRGVFDGSLLISLVGTVYNTDPSRYTVFATVGSTGHQNLSIQRKDVGHETTYEADQTFEIRLAGVESDSAEFVITRTEPPRQTAPEGPSPGDRLAVPEHDSVTVARGHSASAFDSELMISLVGTSFETDPSRYTVFATVGLPGLAAQHIEGEDVGYVAAYGEQGPFEIRIVRTDSDSAEFLVTRMVTEAGPTLTAVAPEESVAVSTRVPRTSQASVVVQEGKTELLFNGELRISLIGTTHVSEPWRYVVDATVGSPGHAILHIQRADVGHVATYQGESAFEILIMAASDRSAEFLVTPIEESGTDSRPQQ